MKIRVGNPECCVLVKSVFTRVTQSSGSDLTLLVFCRSVYLKKHARGHTTAKLLFKNNTPGENLEEATEAACMSHKGCLLAARPDGRRLAERIGVIMKRRRGTKSISGLRGSQGPTRHDKYAAVLPYYKSACLIAAEHVKTISSWYLRNARSGRCCCCHL